MATIASSQGQIIRAVAGLFQDTGFRTLTNDGSGGDAPLERFGRQYRPHIVVLEGEFPVRVVDVETAETLDRGAVARWREAEDTGLPTYVYVPESEYGTAWELKVSARLFGTRLLPLPRWIAAQ